MSRSKTMSAITRRRIENDSVVYANVAAELILGLNAIGVIDLGTVYHSAPEKIATKLAPGIAGVLVLLEESRAGKE